MAKTTTRSVTIAGQRFRLSRVEVERAMRDVLPEPITSHFVVIGSRRYPPKQVIGELTDLERAFFTSHHALRLLRNLGFAVGRAWPRRAAAGGRRARGRGPESSERPVDAALVDRLREVRGQWVATQGDDLLVAAPTPREVVSWLAEHDRQADSMFRVPEDELASSGLAPL
jgi:hypothetical protein